MCEEFDQNHLEREGEESLRRNYTSHLLGFFWFDLFYKG